MSVLCNANCDEGQSRFITRQGTGKHSNFTLTLDPHLCTKLWYSCGDEDTEEFEFLDRGKADNSRTIRYVFKGIDKSDFQNFALLQSGTRANMNLSQWDESIFEDSAVALGEQAKGFGQAFLPGKLAEQLMPAGAEMFCVAMGFKSSLGLTISVCADIGGGEELCEVFPLAIEIGKDGCTDCLSSDTLKGNDPKFDGYEFCYTEANSQEHHTESARHTFEFALMLLIGGTGANMVFQGQREGIKACSWLSQSLLYLFAGVCLGGILLLNGKSDPDRLAFDVQVSGRVGTKSRRVGTKRSTQYCDP
jgi:hypothetical protein